MELHLITVLLSSNLDLVAVIGAPTAAIRRQLGRQTTATRRAIYIRTLLDHKMVLLLVSSQMLPC